MTNYQKGQNSKSSLCINLPILIGILSIIVGLVIGFYPEFIAVIIYIILFIVLLKKSSRIMLYIVVFLSSFSNVVPTQFLNISITSGISLNFWDLIIVFLLFIPWIINKIVNRQKYSLPKNRIFLSLFFIFIIATLSFIYGLFSGNSFNYAIQQYRIYLYSIIIFRITLDQIRDNTQLNILIKSWLFGTFITGLLALFLMQLGNNIYQLLPDLFTNAGSTGGVVPWRLNFRIGASSLTSFSFLIIPWLLNKTTKKWSIALLFYLIYVGLCVTRTFYATLAIVVIIALIFFWNKISFQKKLKLTVLPFFIFLLLIILGKSIPNLINDQSLPDYFSNRIFTSFDLNDQNAVGRVAEIIAATEDILQKPLIGYGLGAERPSYYSTELSDYIHYSVEWNRYYIHNAFIFVGFQLGLFGLILLIVYFYSSIIIGIKLLNSKSSKKLTIYGILLSMTAYIIQSFAWPSYFMEVNSMILLVMFPCWLLIINKNSTNNK